MPGFAGLDLYLLCWDLVAYAKRCYLFPLRGIPVFLSCINRLSIHAGYRCGLNERCTVLNTRGFPSQPLPFLPPASPPSLLLLLVTSPPSLTSTTRAFCASFLQARRLRKALGGGMRQAGVIAAAGLEAVVNNYVRLSEVRCRSIPSPHPPPLFLRVCFLGEIRSVKLRKRVHTRQLTELLSGIGRDCFNHPSVRSDTDNWKALLDLYICNC